MERPRQVQFRRRQQRPRRRSGRSTEQGHERRAGARGQGPCDLRSRQRTAGLSPLARISGAEVQAQRRYRLWRRRHPHHLRLAPGARSGQRHISGPRRHRDHRAGMLPRLDQPADAARRQCRRHSARPRRHAHGGSGVGARRSQAPWRAPEIHLHHSDRAEPDRHDLERGAPARIAAFGLRTRRADLRGRLLCRSDLGRQTAARALRHEQRCGRHPYRLVLQVDRAGAARRLHRRRMDAHFAHAGDQDRRRLRRARADGARRILPGAFRRPICRH